MVLLIAKKFFPVAYTAMASSIVSLLILCASIIMSVVVEQLTKVYGQQTAVDAISFEAERGQVMGFLGPNGAGKSTTMKMVTGYIPPTSGMATVAGISVIENSLEARQKIGYLPESNPLYFDMYVREFLELVASIHKLGKSGKSRIDDMIEMTGLTKERKKRIGQLSKGYKQRVGLAQAMLHDPEVLILDEPTSGLDPNQLVDIRRLIKEFGKDKTVILSTHIMQEVEAMCDRVIIINNGKLVANEGIANMKTLMNNKVSVHVGFEGNVSESFFKNIKGVISAEKSGNEWLLQCDADAEVPAAIFNAVKASDHKLISLYEDKVAMEDVFQQLTRSNQADA